MDFIDISLAEVARTAGSIRSSNQRLESNLKDIKNQMNSLNQTWQSTASQNIIDRFNSLDATIKNYYEVIEKYAKFLDQTVAAYDEAETTINKGASSFK